MRRKAINFRYAPHLTFRYFRPEDMEQCTSDAAKSRDGAYVVIVRKRVCLDDEGYFRYDKLEAAKCIPFSGWSRTNMVYGGTYRKQTQGRHFWVELSTLSLQEQEEYRIQEDADPGEHIVDGRVYHWHDVYWTSVTYWVEDAHVYTASSRTTKDPKAS